MNELIEAGIVTKKIAESLAPLPDTPPLLVAIHKKIPQAEPNHYRIEDLTDDDVRLLLDIWAGLPIPAAWNMTQEQFARCKTVFEAAPNKPTWQIQAEFRDFRNEAKGERTQIAIKHMRQIEAEVKRGSFELLTSHRIPTAKLEPGTLMRIADARAYLQSLGLDTSWLSDIDEPTPDAEAAPAPKVEAATPAPAVPPDDTGLSKREKQIRAIEAESDLLGYARLQIAIGGKTTLRNTCKQKYPDLFGGGNSPFDDAWKDASNSTPPRLRMADHNKFAGK